MNVHQNDRFRLVVMPNTSFKLTTNISARRCNSLFFILSLVLLITVISFLSSIIWSSYSSDSEQVLQDRDGVRIVRVNHFNGLQSVHQYIRQYYGGEYANRWSSQGIKIESMFELKSVEKSDAFRVHQLKSPIATRSDCTQQSCFDLYQCETADNRLRVYIYPIHRIVNHTDDRLLTGEFSREYFQVLQSIRNSPFYTSDIGQACAFVVPIDTLNELQYEKFGLDIVSSLLTEYAYFAKYNGSNHLFFNFIAGRNWRVNLQLGNAMLLSAGLSTFHHRYEFDVSLPVYSPLAEPFTSGRQHFASHINAMMHERRSIEVLLVHNNYLPDAIRPLFNSKDNSVIMQYSSCNTSNAKLYCNDANPFDKQSYEQLLSSASFCLIFDSVRSVATKTMLTEALMFGCIPILTDQWTLVMPFESKIVWSQISLRVPNAHLSKLDKILNSLPTDRRYSMRRDGLVTWSKYLSTIDRIVQTGLIVLNERLFPPTVVSKGKWNDLDLEFDPIACYRLTDPFEQNRCFERNAFDNQWDAIDPTLPEPVDLRHGFTAVILTYDRLDSLLQVIAQVMQAPSLIKIVVIWNHQQNRPPTRHDLLQLISTKTHQTLRVPIDVIVTIENRLSNRFYPFKEIQTDCVLSIDDDITMLNGDELEFGFQIWREFPDRIVGYPSRVHKFDNTTYRWKYDSEWLNEMSMVLTGAAFYHKYYHYLYSFEMSSQIRDWVDEHMNCEDIAINFLVSNVTGKAPIKVTPRKKFKCPECVNQPMLSSDTKSHLAERSDCINLFVQVYGLMPLKYVEYRVDPVLFKDNLPEKLKKYNQIVNI